MKRLNLSINIPQIAAPTWPKIKANMQSNPMFLSISPESGRFGRIRGPFLSIQSIAPSCSLQLNINSAVDKSYNNNDIEVP